jgi:hypothetical protein
MNTAFKPNGPRKWAVVLIAAAATAGLTWGLLSQSSFLSGQTPASSSPAPSMIFTTAHSSVGEAVRHFFDIRPDPVQPIAFKHIVHNDVAELACTDCHDGATQGPTAKIPSVVWCMSCHSDESLAAGNPEPQKIRDYYARGEEIPWQRVYGWYEEDHVRFNHAPHSRAEVTCETCHGNVAQLDVAEKAVEHTMGFCLTCHTGEEGQPSNDCLVCHY